MKVRERERERDEIVSSYACWKCDVCGSEDAMEEGEEKDGETYREIRRRSIAMDERKAFEMVNR